MIDSKRNTRAAASTAFSEIVHEVKYFDCFFEFRQISISIHSLGLVHVSDLFSGKARSMLEHPIDLHHSIVGS
jgi:hypothetical protein